MDLMIEALKAAEDALSRCYNVTEWPADGTTPQDDALTKVRAALAAPAAQQEFKATATRIVYRPKRGRKGVMCITSWMPLGDFPPNVGEVLEETVLYEKTKPAISIP